MVSPSSVALKSTTSTPTPSLSTIDATASLRSFQEPEIGNYTESKLLAMKPAELQRACRDREVRELVCIQSMKMNQFWKRKTEYDFGKTHNLSGFRDTDDWLMIHFLKSVGAQFNSVAELTQSRVLDLSNTDSTKIRKFPRRGLKMISYETGREVPIVWRNLETIDLSFNALADLPEMDYRQYMPNLKMIKMINVPLNPTLTRYLKKYPNIIFQAGEGDFRNASRRQLQSLGLETGSRASQASVSSQASYVQPTMTRAEQSYYEKREEGGSSSGILNSLDLASSQPFASVSRGSVITASPSLVQKGQGQMGGGLFSEDEESSGIMQSLKPMSATATMEEESSGIMASLHAMGGKGGSIGMTRDIEFYFA
jgi:hypothetical protein